MSDVFSFFEFVKNYISVLPADVLEIFLALISVLLGAITVKWILSML